MATIISHPVENKKIILSEGRGGLDILIGITRKEARFTNRNTSVKQCLSLRKEYHKGWMAGNI